MALDSEYGKLRQDKIPDPLADFDLKIIDLIPSALDQDGLRGVYHQEVAELESGELRQRMIEVMGREISPAEINQLFCFPEKRMSGHALINRGKNENILEMSTILLKQQESETEYAGIVNLAFRKYAYPYLFIRRRELETTGEQIGLEIQCRLEKFCRDNGIWKIHNEAKSRPENHLGDGNRQAVGAYVWARCGYEFEGRVDALGVLEKFLEYAVRHGIEPQKKYVGFGRAIDYAKMTGKDREGNIVPLGKDFFLNTRVIWRGVRDLRLDSPGTKIFIEYLEEKGRADLIEKYLT
jgi:hypothetical protein